MKVKVTHTIDVNEVPKFVNQIVADCRFILEQQCSKMDVKLHDVPGTVEEFKYIVTNLNLVQDKIEDAVNIIVGWSDAVNSLPADITKSLETEEQEDEDV